MVMTPKRRLRRSVFASLFKLIVCTSNVLTKLVLPPTLVPDKAYRKFRKQLAFRLQFAGHFRVELGLLVRAIDIPQFVPGPSGARARPSC